MQMRLQLSHMETNGLWQALLHSSQYDTLIIMSETKLSHRQNYILNVINASQGIGRLRIEKQVSSLYPASKPTIARDLAILSAKNAIRVEGRGKSTLYLPLTTDPLFKVFDLDQYFALGPDSRVTAKKTFDFSIF